MNLNRRRAMLLGTVAIASVATSCSGQNPVDVIKTVADFIQAVQQGVVTKIKDVCQTATAYVPTVETVLAITAQILQAAGVVAGNLSDAVKQLQKVVDAIVAAGCPTPAPSPNPSGTFGSTPVRFYT